MKRNQRIMRFALALMLTCLWSVTALAGPTAMTIPGFSNPVLDGLTQPSNGTWDNVIPNALADYYTYVPYTTADAVKLGFPPTCGNLAKGDSTSSEDCYTITVKSFMQPLSLNGLGPFTGQGLIGLDGVTSLQTKAWGYGSGGANWTPPYLDATKGVLPGTTVTGNAPTPFADGTLSAAGIWHFPAPTIKGTFGRPIRVQWLNELPNEAPTGLDPSVDCGPNAPNCFPYNRITTHVHGAHTTPESDGLASAWFTPNFAIVGEDFVSTRQFGPEGTYHYPMDQEASTIWYHDHAMGTTHNNTNMGMAGFFPITDANEQALIANKILPTGAYELGFALQDRHFDAATGNMVMPDFPIYDLNACGGAVDVNGLPDTTICPMVPWMKDPADGHLVPFVAGHAWLADPINAGAPFGGTSATLEYFGNIPVVNGVVYGKYNVEPRVYRMRFIGGTDSRTWVMKLVYTDPVTAAPVVVPFWQIGTEQGLLNNPVLRQEMDLMPGERLDVLVDFSGIPAGTRVMMKNMGDDAPWPGYFDYLASVKAGLWVQSPTIPEIMAFDVIPLSAPDTIVPPSATTSLRPMAPAVPPASPAPAVNNIRVVSLMEITDGYGRTMPTIDARGFKPVGIPVTEIVKLNDIEQWDIVNTTVDAHPMHLHQVAFKVIDRQLIDPAGFVPPIDNILAQVFTPPSYTVMPGSLPIPPDPWDDGWKDTVATPPGYVTRVWAKFDIPGEYVWHCHILSHEEHDMMRNFVVASTAASPPTSLTVPLFSTGVGLTANVTVGASPTAGVNHLVEYKLLADTNWTTNLSTGLNPTITFPAVGVYQLRAKAVDAALTPTRANSPYIAGSNTITVAPPPTAPTGLRATIISTTFVILSWTDTSLNESGFYVERSADNGVTWVRVGQTKANSTTFRNLPLTRGTAYQYRVQAFNANGGSAFSNTLPVTTKP
jgi:spore coat protein A